MKPSKANWNDFFSHIYIEKEARYYPLCQKILRHFPDSIQIPIQNYQDVFMQNKQHFSLQKNSPKLILAVKHSSFLYKGSPMCNAYGHRHFYYLSNVLNCFYHCDYCYLQGMHPSANLVVFVNILDALAEVTKGPDMFLSLSYDTDLLALEHWTGILKHWLTLDTPSTMEIRTKSANFTAIAAIPARKNIILSWTLSPEPVIQAYEHRTPSLAARLQNIEKALCLGWPVRICLDPILWIQDWEKQYKALIDTIFETIQADQLIDVSFGVFRCNKQYFKRMKKLNPAAILADPVQKEGHYTYPDEVITVMEAFITKQLRQYLPEEKIQFWS